MSKVIPMHTARAARAKGVALATACTANRLGLSPRQVMKVAEAAADKYRAGQLSAARAVADAKAELLRSISHEVA